MNERFLFPAVLVAVLPGVTLYLWMSSFRPDGWRPNQVVAEMVAPTTIETGNRSFRTFWLCHMKDKSSYLTFTDRLTSLGYALALTKDCVTLKYQMISESEFIAYQRAGKIDPTLPSVPVLSLRDKLAPFFLPTLLLMLGLTAIVAKVMQARSAARAQVPRGLDKQLYQVLCHAAAISGLPAGLTAQQVSGQIASRTGQTIASDKLAAFIASGAARLSIADLKRLGEGLTASERSELLRAVAALSAGAVSDEFRTFQARLVEQFERQGPLSGSGQAALG